MAKFLIDVPDEFINSAPDYEVDSDDAILDRLKEGEQSDSVAKARLSYEATHPSLARKLLFGVTMVYRLLYGTREVIRKAARKHGMVGGGGGDGNDKSGFVDEDDPAACEKAVHNMLNNAGGQLLLQGKILIRHNYHLQPEDIMDQLYGRLTKNWNRYREKLNEDVQEKML